MDERRRRHFQRVNQLADLAQADAFGARGHLLDKQAAAVPACLILAICRLSVEMPDGIVRRELRQDELPEAIAQRGRDPVHVVGCHDPDNLSQLSRRVGFADAGRARLDDWRQREATPGRTFSGPT